MELSIRTNACPPLTNGQRRTRAHVSAHLFQSPRCRQSHLHNRRLESSPLGAIGRSSRERGASGRAGGTVSLPAEGEPQSGRHTHSRVSARHLPGEAQKTYISEKLCAT